MSHNPLMTALADFKRELQFRKGTDEQGMLVLFAYATETSPSRPPLTAYLDAMLGPPKKIENVGKLDYKVLAFEQLPSGLKRVTLGLTAEQVTTANAILARTHPLSAIQPDHQFDFSSGKEICYLSFHFDDNYIMNVAVERELDFIGVGAYMMKDISLVDSLPPVGPATTILGDYQLSVADAEGETAPSPTHQITITQLPY